jgi:hypothetical protein
MWPWRWRREQVEKAEKAGEEAEGRRAIAEQVVAWSREESQKLHAEVAKNSWTLLFIEAFHNKGESL